MFPKMFLYGLRKFTPCCTELFSLQECANPYNGNSHVYSFDQFPERHGEKPFDAVVIGGGEFLHFRPIEVTIAGQQVCYPDGYLWRKPMAFAREYKIPAFINCIGASVDFTQEQQSELRETMAGAKAVALRDAFSLERVKRAGVDNAFCVADNLWYMNQMYSSDKLAGIRARLGRGAGLDLTSPYIVVQYGTTKDIAELARQLFAVKQIAGCRIILMSVNYCHEDRQGAQQLYQAGHGEFEQLTAYLQPEDMIAVINNAKAFIGTSLHGNLTAASYGVPFLGIDMYPAFVGKMDGIFSMMGCYQYLLPKAEGLAAAFERRSIDKIVQRSVEENVAQMQNKLDRYFQKMAEAMRCGNDG